MEITVLSLLVGGVVICVHLLTQIRLTLDKIATRLTAEPTPAPSTQTTR